MFQMPQVLNETHKRKQAGLFARIFRSAPALDPGDGMRIAPGVRASPHEEGATLFHTHTGLVFSCDRVGARIWAGLASGRSIDAISGDIATAYGVERERARSDAEAFVRALASNGLVARRVR
jgi:hypothetical protein